MITFKLKGKVFGLLLPIFPGQTSTAEGWSQMRWVVVGPSTPPSMVESLKESGWGSTGYSIEIDDESILLDMKTRGINLAQLDTLWNYVMVEIANSQLWSTTLESIWNEQIFSNWIFPQIEAVQRPLNNEFIERRREDPSFVVEKESAKLNAKLRLTMSTTYVHTPPRIFELVVEILDHVHWLVVSRFDDHVDFDRDLTVASIWLGPEFNVFLNTGQPHGFRMQDKLEQPLRYAPLQRGSAKTGLTS